MYATLVWCEISAQDEIMSNAKGNNGWCGFEHCLFFTEVIYNIFGIVAQ